MEFRSIGSLAVSAVGLGCNNFGMRLDRGATRAVIDAALDAGITFLDTADIYGSTDSETFIGEAIRGRRDRLIIATKFGMQIGDDEEKQGGSPRWVNQAVDDSLRRLQVDHIDLYQMHRPDPAVPVAETLDALDAVVKSGKVREIGHSNFSGEQIDEAESVARDRDVARFVCAQNRYSLVHREVEQDVLPAVERVGLAFLPYFPLASGLLTGKYRRGRPFPEGARLASVPPERAARFASEEAFDLVESLIDLGERHGRSILDIAFGWLLAKPPVASVIAGATSPTQIEANVAAAARPLAPELLAEVETLLT